MECDVDVYAAVNGLVYIRLGPDSNGNDLHFQTEQEHIHTLSQKHLTTGSPQTHGMKDSFWRGGSVQNLAQSRVRRNVGKSWPESVYGLSDCLDTI